MSKFNYSEKDWLEYSIADLETAKYTLENSDNYHISVFHSQQAIEKILKRKYIIEDKQFEFTHDINLLFRRLINDASSNEDNKIFDKLSIVMELFSASKYPSGDRITREDAQLAFSIAKEMVSLFR